MALRKIVSGGQTGVDRGALDAALVAGFSCGGWCPADRAAEDGVIPDRYPLTHLPVEFAAGRRPRAPVRESGCLFDETKDLAEPSEKLVMDDGAEPTSDGQRDVIRTVRPDEEQSPTARQVAEQYRARTLKNVQDSDGTVILYSETLSGGTLLTQKLCMRERKPFIALDANEMTKLRAADAVVRFVEEHGIGVLNVAGPRLSGWAKGYGFALQVMGIVISNTELPQD
jgi:Circularly permutated YpsA SLOG family